MQILRPAGRAAASRKYDTLTALGTMALTGSKHDQRRILRFITLITARYNWQRNLLAVGQSEIARLWSCDERTVKREMARFRAEGWLVVRRQGARGRVSEFGLDLDRVMTATRPFWDNIGPDYVARLSAGVADEAEIVPLPVRGTVPTPPSGGTQEWDVARLMLHGEDAGSYAAWVHALTREGRAGDRLILKAPSRFHASYVATHLASRLLAACREVDDGIGSLEIVF